MICSNRLKTSAECSEDRIAFSSHFFENQKQNKNLNNESSLGFVFIPMWL